MKTNQTLMIGAMTLCLSLATVSDLHAQAATVQTTTTTRNMGTVTETSPDTLIIRSDAATAPIRYRSTKTTTYVDENGAPVALETVKSGVPVTVEYRRMGDDLVATHVVIRKIILPDGKVIQKKTTIRTTTEEKD